ncbi:MAG: GNAT family N-acetyltransferase [Candidatus Krumholzibacteria bacterium]|nr:GNAT family N-acetyltransferase [Candidatus Krumholzibacteria bacterium]
MKNNSPGHGQPKISFRTTVRLDDCDTVQEIIEATGYFTPAEVGVAVELVQDNMTKGAADSGYYFIFAELEGRTVGYVCYGPIPCTVSSHNLYWIAVHPDFQRLGLGKSLMREFEKQVKAAHGTRIYIDTSYKTQYEDTRAFYQSLGYELDALLKDFYAPGDDKVIYRKLL